MSCSSRRKPARAWLAWTVQISAGMAGVPGFEERQRLTAANLANNDPVRTQPHGGPQQPLHIHGIGRAEGDRVVRRALKFAGILDDHQTMLRRSPDDLGDDRIG